MGTQTFAQPYAPEYLEQLPAYIAPPGADVSAPKPEVTSRSDDAGAKKVAAIREFMTAEATAVRETGETSDTAVTERILTPSDYLRVFVWLCVIIAAILLLGVAVRRWGRKTPLLAGADLGKVMGRVYLDRNVSVHYVETAGQVLVIGVTQNAITLLASFDQSVFSKSRATGPELSSVAETPSDFLRHLESSTTRMRAETGDTAPDAEIQALQSNIARLQRYLKEEAREYRQ
jgi:flagellar biogenesis protein FliO